MASTPEQTQTREFDSQLLIRIDRSQREEFQAEAKRRKTTASELIRQFISSTLPENEESPGLQTGTSDAHPRPVKRGDAISPS